jgi:methionyl aminopeptidase
MEEDEIYAIETYATTGFGVMTQNSEMPRCTHFMETNHAEIDANKAITKKDKKFFRQTELYQWLQTRKGLPFSSSWIDVKAVPKVDKAFKLGIPSGQLIAYPPMFDEANSVVAQFEHTIHVNDGSVEVFSLGEDY